MRCRRIEAKRRAARIGAMTSQTQIAQRVVESILAQKLAPGGRLGEQELADLFGVSRTLVREALMQLQARGFVEVRTRKGWYVVEPSFEQARDAFAARRVIETGMLREAGKPLQTVIRRLREHVAEERAAIASGDAATRTFLLADFHVCLADCLGNRLLTDVMRDLTARTTLVASLYQSTHDASQSCDDHEAIVAALAKGDTAKAERLMVEHIGSVQETLDESSAGSTDTRERLRASLAPVKRAGA
jgi:DNA-binding GntR family transcriptional regulator